MNQLEFYTAHSDFTHPAEWSHLLDALPDGIPELCQAIQGLVVHYVASGIAFTPERLKEIDTRWVKGICRTLHARDDRPLIQPREPSERLVGCCRDFALLFVAALRQKGIPARSRVGFSTYLSPSFFHDHVVGEYWNGQRWVMVDPEFAPGIFGFDIQDMPKGVFFSAAQVWQAFRQGQINPELYGVAPQLPWKGDWFIRNYVVKELSHLCKHELLLWDQWGVMTEQLGNDLEPIDQLAELLMQGDAAFEDWLKAYQKPVFQVPEQVFCQSPTGNLRPERIATTVL